MSCRPEIRSNNVNEVNTVSQLIFQYLFFQRSALTEEDILNVAKKLADELSIRTLGLALGVDGSVIDAAVADQNKVNLQALTVLKAWREKVGPDEAAYFQLGNTSGIKNS